MGFFVHESLCKYDLNTYFEDWHANSIVASYNEWKNIVYQNISGYEDNSWHICCKNHPVMN